MEYFNNDFTDIIYFPKTLKLRLILKSQLEFIFKINEYMTPFKKIQIVLNMYNNNKYVR